MIGHILASGGIASGIGGLFFILIAIACYFIPTIVAVSRHVPNTASVVVINFFLGWTFIGWVVALAMSVRSR
jgi:RsiW-degrading membrane proteinase PrsW (M82 family)